MLQGTLVQLQDGLHQDFADLCADGAGAVYQCFICCRSATPVHNSREGTREKWQLVRPQALWGFVGNAAGVGEAR